MQEIFDIQSVIELGIVQHILTSLRVKGSANMKLQLLGLYTAIKTAQERNIVVTANILIELSGLGRTSISNLTRALQAEGLIEVSKTYASHGKGYSYTFKAIAPEELVEKILKGYLKGKTANEAR